MCEKLFFIFMHQIDKRTIVCTQNKIVIFILKEATRMPFHWPHSSWIVTGFNKSSETKTFSHSRLPLRGTPHLDDYHRGTDPQPFTRLARV